MYRPYADSYYVAPGFGMGSAYIGGAQCYPPVVGTPLVGGAVVAPGIGFGTPLVGHMPFI